MTEEISSIYDNVSIEEWADRIHENKIQELQELLNRKKKEFEPYTEQAKVNFYGNVHEALEGLAVGLDMLNLTFKLKALQAHRRK